MTWATPTNITDMSGLFIYVILASNNIFAYMLAITIFIIAMGTQMLGGQSLARALIVSLFIDFVVMALMWGAGVIPAAIVIILLCLLVLSFVLLYITS